MCGKRINPHGSKCLAKVSQKVMTKLLLQSISSYMMSIFLLASALIATIEKMMNSFCWENNGLNNCEIHWMSWEKLVVHKINEGMGFKDLTTFNLAMILWSLGFSKPNTILTLIFWHHPWDTTNVTGGEAFSVLNLLFRWDLEGGCICLGDNIPVFKEHWFV